MYPDPVNADNTTLPPVQNVIGPPAVMDAVGETFTVTVVIAEVRVHPLLPVTVTL